MSTTTVPVLIVGGGPVGPAASLVLAERGIPSLLIERHAGTSIHPRARGINFRTMELFRELGLEAQIRAAGSELVADSGMLIVETLASAERARIAMAEPFSSSQSTGAISPTSGCMCAQDQLEPLLLAAARQRGCEVQFHTELVSFEQDLSGVTALVRDLESGQQQTIAARYMIAADGPTSRIRQALGIPTSGRGSLGHQLASILLPTWATWCADANSSSARSRILRRLGCFSQSTTRISGSSSFRITRSKGRQLRTFRQSAVRICCTKRLAYLG